MASLAIGQRLDPLLRNNQATHLSTSKIFTHGQLESGEYTLGPATLLPHLTRPSKDVYPEEESRDAT